MTPQRVYLVREKSKGAMCLVLAQNKSQALRLYAEQFTTCELATTATVMQLMERGATVIKAPTEPVQTDLVADTQEPPPVRKASEVFAAMEKSNGQ